MANYEHLNLLRVEGLVEVSDRDSNPPVSSLFESLAVALSKAAHR